MSNIDQRKNNTLIGPEPYRMGDDLHVPIYSRSDRRKIHHVITAAGHQRMKDHSKARWDGRKKGIVVEFDEHSSMVILRALEHSVHTKMANFYAKFDELMDDMYLAEGSQLFNDAPIAFKQLKGRFRSLSSELADFTEMQRSLAKYNVSRIDPIAKDAFIRLRKILDVNIKSIKVCITRADSYYAGLHDLKEV